MKFAAFIIGFCIPWGVLAGGTWQLGQTPSSEVLSGMTYPNESYAFAVGNNGTIVQFTSGDSGTIMSSGTMKNLYDVYATDGDTAIAAGEDTVLLWDGSSWTSMFENNDGINYTSTWITPGKDVFLYQSLGFFNFVCPYIPELTEQPLCRGSQSPVYAYCGDSDNLKYFFGDGSILNTENIKEVTPTEAIIHEEPVPLDLTAVWAPQWNCLPGGIEPLELFAIQNNNDFYRFDGSDWVNMNVDVPNDHVLTWIGGYNNSQIKAVGYKPDGKGGNEGVLWEYDGTNWTDESLSLPNGTPGMTDIAYNTGLPNLIFAGDFEEITLRNKNTVATGVDILAAAEAGRYLQVQDLFPQAQLPDLQVQQTLLTPQPIQQGDQITYRVRVLNIGDADAMNFRLIYSYIEEQTLELVNDGCGLQEFNSYVGWKYRDKIVPLLAANDFMECNMTFNVLAPGLSGLTNIADVHYSSSERNKTNNRSRIDVTVQ